MSNLLEMPLVMAALAFTAGYVLAKLGALFKGRERAADKGDTERDRHYRAIEADLRIARKQVEEAEKDIGAIKRERGELVAELDERSAELLEATTQIVDLQDQLKDECSKTQNLRNELSDRAEQSIRAQVQIRDMETELSLAHAGSDAVSDEIHQLIADREELSARLAELQSLQAAQETGNDPVAPSHPRRRMEDRLVDDAQDLVQRANAALDGVDH